LPNSKGPPSSLVQLRTVTTHDGARDTRPDPDIHGVAMDGPAVCYCYADPELIRLSTTSFVAAIRLLG
jgi:hypothetical protein